MFWQEIKNIKSSDKDIRGFGLVSGGVAVLIALFWWWSRGDMPAELLIIAGLLIGLGIIAPAILRPLQKGWMALALLLGWIMTRVILSVLFFLIITPMAMIARLFGKEFLTLRKQKGEYTYWHKRV